MSEVEQFSPYKRRKYSMMEQTKIRKEFRRRHGCCNCLNEWDFDMNKQIDEKYPH